MVASVCLVPLNLTYWVQFIVYLLIFKYLSGHDRNMVSMLPEATMKQRRRKNVIDLIGHALYLGVFMLYAPMLVIGNYLMSSLLENGVLSFVMIFLSIYGVGGICHMLSAPPVRRELQNAMLGLVQTAQQRLDQVPILWDSFSTLALRQQ